MTDRNFRTALNAAELMLNGLGEAMATRVAKQWEDKCRKLERAERALKRTGWTYTEGAEEWKPPLGPSASPLLDEIDVLRAQVEQLQAKVDGTKAGRDFHIGTASELLALLADIIDAENDFRESMGVNWEGDPLSDAIEAARRFIKLETPALSSTERRGSE